MNGFKTAELFEAFGMHFGVNLHQTFRTDRAASLRVKRGFSRNNCQNQQRVNVVVFTGNKRLLYNFSRIFAIYAIMLCDKTSGIGFHSINDLLLGFERLSQIFAFEIGVAQRFNLQRRLGLGSFRVGNSLRRRNCQCILCVERAQSQQKDQCQRHGRSNLFAPENRFFLTSA